MPLRPLLLCCCLLAAPAADLPPDSSASPVYGRFGIGVAGTSPYIDSWQFVDMMRHSREWRARAGDKQWTVVEDAAQLPVAIRHRETGEERPITPENRVWMWIYNRRIEGEVVLRWQGDAEVRIERRNTELLSDDYPQRGRRVYRFGPGEGEVFDLEIVRNNPADPLRDLHLWMPGFEDGGPEGVLFHPQFKRNLEPFAYLRFMDWGSTNNSKQRDWSDRVLPQAMRQSGAVAYEHMIRLANELDKDPWICVPHLATDDYVRELGRLIKAQLEPERLVYIEYSNEIWNPAFDQTRWLWEQAKREIAEQGLKQRPWEYGATLCGRRSAEIWAILADEVGEDRIIRTLTHFRWLDRAVEAALSHGDRRLDLIALNGYFINHDALAFAQRSLASWDADRVFDVLEQLHLLEDAGQWRQEIAAARKHGVPISCYEGGQHFANPFQSSKQGDELVARMFEVNADPRIKRLYASALETWRQAGGDGFTPFVDCSNWSKFGCWGHMQYTTQPLDDVLGPDGAVLERGAHKMRALHDELERRVGWQPQRAARIQSVDLPTPVLGQSYEARLEASGGTPPYRWYVHGGRLPDGLTLSPEGLLQGTPSRAEQLRSLIGLTDAAGVHASVNLGLFMDPVASADWRDVSTQVDRETALPASAGTAGYHVRLRTRNRGRSVHQLSGIHACLTPDGDPEDHLRIGLDGPGTEVQAFSRYVKDGEGELWGRRTARIVPDPDEDGQDGARPWDEGETWTLQITLRPASSPGAIDLLLGVWDQDGRPRLDSSGGERCANGFVLLRELALKPALREGPFRLVADGAEIVQVEYAPLDQRR